MFGLGWRRGKCGKREIEFAESSSRRICGFGFSFGRVYEEEFGGLKFEDDEIVNGLWLCSVYNFKMDVNDVRITITMC